MTVDTLPTIDYSTVKLADLRVIDKTPQNRSLDPDGRKKKRHPSNLYVTNGEDYEIPTTQRFWQSFNQLFKVNDMFFEHWTHEEVFNRIVQNIGNIPLRLAISDQDQFQTALAMSPVEKGVINVEQCLDIMNRYEGECPLYRTGIMTMMFTPKVANQSYKIGGDDFNNQYYVEVPIDGFQKPAIHVALQRLACTNQLIAYSTEFKSEINLGRDSVHTLTALDKAVGSYHNDKAYDVLQKRVQSAQQSYASIAELIAFEKLLIKHKIHRLDPEGWTNFFQKVGDLKRMYQVANLEELSHNKKRIFPTKAKVYDIINYATELATHSLDTELVPVFNRHIGGLVKKEYDLEGSAEKLEDFDDLFNKKISKR